MQEKFYFIDSIRHIGNVLEATNVGKTSLLGNVVKIPLRQSFCSSWV